ncbi:unnamed protein product [Spirodela intermedia]|uniref:Uncharacterized protein n=1 Tax=Spirodela intermedia TaxID=51605 RepID=A0A7I8K488_SPIIN|nr:unnamed protein product [Spirodela intermedia]
MPSGSSQLKQCSSCATAISRAYRPSCIPGQDRRPEPKGMNSKQEPLKSGASAAANLAGLNESASSQAERSRAMAHTLIFTVVRAGMW